MRTAAILPVKRFALAKQRLGEALPADWRRELAAMMVADVLDALHATPELDAIVVVTNEPAAASAAERVGASVIPDETESGQSPAAQAGVGYAVREGAERVLLVPGDCPAVDPREVAALLPATAEPRVVIVPDRHGSGTNALVLTPPEVIAASFGPGSRARHEALAAEAGVQCTVAQPASLLLDIDTGADLGALRERLAANRRAGRAHTGLAARPRRRARRRAALSEAAMSQLSARALPGLPEIERGVDLAALVADAAGDAGEPLDDATVIVIAHKAVSKAEGAVVSLAGVTAGEQARALAERLGKPDARAVQVVLDECVEVVRAERGVIIGRTRHGFVCANAGVDASNARAADELVLLPRDPDASARALRARLRELTGAGPAVVISDSFGRAWRHGQMRHRDRVCRADPAAGLARAPGQRRTRDAGHAHRRGRRRGRGRGSRTREGLPGAGGARTRSRRARHE